MQNFKVGDWVRDKVNGKVVQLAEHFHPGGIELWEPKPGEWCWFWNEYSDVPILAKLISIGSVFGRPLEYKVKTPSCISEISYNYMSNMSFKKCEPFIGQLPSFLKDNT